MKLKRHSRSLWLNYGLLVLSGVVEMVPSLQTLLPTWSRALVALAALGNIVLRHATTEPLEPLLPARPPPEPPA